MSRRRIAVAAAAAVVAATVLAGCATGGPVAGSSGESSRPPFLTTSPSPTPTEGATISVSPARSAAIVADLASRGVTETPTVVSARSVQWPNGALGCPSPGQSYIQQIIDGAQIVVHADGRDWDYRFGSGDTPLLCQA